MNIQSAIDDFNCRWSINSSSVIKCCSSKAVIIGDGVGGTPVSIPSLIECYSTRISLNFKRILFNSGWDYTKY